LFCRARSIGGSLCNLVNSSCRRDRRQQDLESPRRALVAGTALRSSLRSGAWGSRLPRARLALSFPQGLHCSRHGGARDWDRHSSPVARRPASDTLPDRSTVRTEF